MRTKLGLAAISFSLGFLLVACGGGNEPSSSEGQVTSPQSTDTGSSGSNKVSLAIKYVAYEEEDGTAVLTEEEARSNLMGINQLWSQCGIAFQLEKFETVDAGDDSLNTYPKNKDEMALIRKAFDESNMLLVVTTGKWDRSGTLGASTVDAWTSTPGSSGHGVVLEKPVATNSNMIAHELGHYLNLNHVSDESNVMNPVVYRTSTVLTKDQCSTARSAVANYWQKMLR